MIRQHQYHALIQKLQLTRLRKIEKIFQLTVTTHFEMTRVNGRDLNLKLQGLLDFCKRAPDVAALSQLRPSTYGQSVDEKLLSQELL